MERSERFSQTLMRLCGMLAWNLDMIRARVCVGLQSLALVETAIDVENQVISPRGSLPIGVILRCDKTKRSMALIRYP